MKLNSEYTEHAGEFKRVSNVVMENVGVSRMGTCDACGTPIKNHVGIFHPEVGYHFVGSCCAGILCGVEEVVKPEPGTRFERNGRTYITVSDGFVQSMKDLLYREIPGSASMFKTYRCNSFTESIYVTLTESHNQALSEKQYSAIVKAMPELLA